MSTQHGHLYLVSFTADREIELADIQDKLREVLNRQTLGVKPGTLEIREMEYNPFDRLQQQG